jgi:DNA repair protein RadA/Sms
LSKVKTVFYCQACGAQSPKWVGKCLQCGQWNTFAEEIINTQKPTAWSSQNKTTNKPILLNDVAEQNAQRMPLPDAELSRVLGGGLWVAGSLTLLGGEPGIGKSTILLQLALQLKATVLYVSGEESEQQIKIRANRIGTNNENCYILSETDVDLIFQQAQNLKPHLVIIDSVQTLFTSKIESTPGSVSQIRSCAAELMRYAKETHTPVMMIGHITKDGSIAGPKVLEHMVDTVLHFEGDRNHVYRILRAQKKQVWFNLRTRDIRNVG